MKRATVKDPYREQIKWMIVAIVICIAITATGIMYTIKAVEQFEKDHQQAKAECAEAGGVLIDWVCFNHTVVIRP